MWSFLYYCDYIGLVQRSEKEILPKDLSYRSCPDVFAEMCRESARKALAEILSRDLVQRAGVWLGDLLWMACTEILVRDPVKNLLRRPLGHTICRAYIGILRSSFYREPLEEIRILYRDLRTGNLQNLTWYPFS